MGAPSAPPAPPPKPATSAPSVALRAVPGALVGLLAASAWRDDALSLAAGLLLAASAVVAAVLRRMGRPAAPWTEPATAALVGAGWALFAAVLATKLPFRWEGELLPAYAFALVLGLATFRKHKVLLDAGKRGPAFAWLLVGYGAAGWGGYSLATIAVESPQITAIFGAVYGLYGAKLLLAFAAEARDGDYRENMTPREAAVSWVKANSAMIAIFAVVLVTYAAFRDRLAATVPYFPLVEFAFGVAVFGVAVQRLRSRIAKEMPEAPLASPRRAHEPRVASIFDPDYESVRRPVEGFVESGRGADFYTTAVKLATGLPDGVAARALAPVAEYRPPPRDPALPLAWASGAVLASAAGAALAVIALMFRVGSPPPSIPFGLAGAVLGLGVYRLQDELMKRREIAGALGAGVGGILLSASSVVLMLAAETSGAVLASSSFWTFVLVPTGALLAVPAWRAWRYRTGKRTVPDIVEAPADEIARGIQGARRRVLVTSVALAVVALLVAPVLSLLALAAWPLRGVVEGFLDAFELVMPPVAVVILGLGVAGGIRWAGLVRARDGVMAEAARRRAERLALHKEVMRRLDATALR